MKQLFIPNGFHFPKCSLYLRKITIRFLCEMLQLSLRFMALIRTMLLLNKNRIRELEKANDDFHVSIITSVTDSLGAH